MGRTEDRWNKEITRQPIENRNLRMQVESYIDRVSLSGKIIGMEEKKLIMKGASQFDDLKRAMPYIEEVLSYLLTHKNQENKSVINDNNSWKQAEILAEKLERFAENYDYYDYKDRLVDRTQQVQDLAGDIFMGKTYGIEDFLYGVIDESEEAERAGAAIRLCSEVKEYTEERKRGVYHHESKMLDRSDSIKEMLNENRTRMGQDTRKQEQKNRKNVRATNRKGEVGVYSKIYANPITENVEILPNVCENTDIEFDVHFI